MDAKPNYNDGYLVVNPKNAGHFGNIHIGGIKYTDDGHLKEMKMQIERHVDRVHNVQIIYDSWLCGSCGDEHKTKKEAEECCKEVR
ncbi:MAG: hypothetical protein PHT07_24365 [Paludibacter sp.]|nr:hypothetical protein [Paludibacter sp.]